MRMLKATAIYIIVVYLISLVITWQSGIGLIVPLIVAALPSILGIVIGALLFSIVRSPSGETRILRVTSALISAVLAASLDFFVFLRGLPIDFKEPGGGFGVPILIAIAYTSLIAGVAGAIFGSGVGQIPRNKEAEQ